MDKPLEIFRKVNELADAHYTNEQSRHVDFLSACHKALAEYFEEYFKDGFIFSALSFSKNNELHYVDEATDNGYIFNKGSVKNWEELSALFTEYIKEVSDKEIISITKILLNKNNTAARKDLFFTCCANCKYQIDILSNGNEENTKVFEYQLGTFNDDKESYYNSNRTKLDKFHEAFSNGSYEQSKGLYDKYIWDYHQLADKYKTGNDKSDFLLHFIKPSIAELDYGLLLSLATNQQLKSDELAFVNLILYRVVSQTATEKMREAERLKTKTMFSLTTHSLKTHLDTGVIKLKNAFKDKLSSYPTLLNEFSELDEETEELRKLTSLLSLIDKIDDENEFKKEATKSNLLTKSNANYNLSEHLIRFNSGHAAMPDIEVKSAIEIEKFSLSLPIFGMYFSDRLLKLFFNTLFENVISYGKHDKNKIALTIETESGCWTFSNETEDETIPFDPTKVKGNLRLFQLLIEETNSGSFLIDNFQKHKFKIEIRAGSNE